MTLVISAYIQRIICCGITLGLLQAMEAEAATDNETAFSLAKMEISDRDDKTTFSLRFSEKPNFVHAFALTDPNRLVIDVGGTIDPPLARVHEHSGGGVVRVRVGRHTQHVRFVLDFERNDVPHYVIHQAGNAVTAHWKKHPTRLHSKATSTRTPIEVSAPAIAPVRDPVGTSITGPLQSGSLAPTVTRLREVPSTTPGIMPPATRNDTSPRSGQPDHRHPPVHDLIMPATQQTETEQNVAVRSETGAQTQGFLQSESDGNAASPHFRRAQALYKEGNLNAAIKQWDKALEVAPENANAHYHKGLALEARGDLDQAVTQYREATRLKPTEVNFYVQLARAYEITEDNVAALTTYQDALILKPSSAHLHNRVGHLLAAEGKLKAAADSWRQTILHQPDYAFAYISLANVLDETGKKVEALSLFKKALSLDPRGPFATEVRQKITRLQTPAS